MKFGSAADKIYALLQVKQPSDEEIWDAVKDCHVLEN